MPHRDRDSSTMLCHARTKMLWRGQCYTTPALEGCAMTHRGVGIVALCHVAQRLRLYKEDSAVPHRLWALIRSLIRVIVSTYL